jgi:ribosomal protein L37AE/L43A
MKNSKHCPACDAKTARTREFDENGKPVWQCANCYRTTKRIVRAWKPRTEVDRLFEELTKES